jgi:hypothetical protein
MSVIAIGIIIYYFVFEVFYWTRRLPIDVAKAVKANERRVDGVVSGIKQFYNYHGYLPDTINELVRDVDDHRPWVLLVDDEWGRLIEYTVSYSGTSTVVRVWSYGSDGKPGGISSAKDTFREWRPRRVSVP